MVVPSVLGWRGLRRILFKVAYPDQRPHYFGKPHPDPYWSESWVPIRPRIEVKIQELWRLKKES